MIDKKFLLGSAVVLAAAFYATGAHAQSQEPYVKGEVSPLSGMYVGAYGGYGWSDVDFSAGPDPDVNGFDYGGFVGYSLDTLLDRTLGLGINMSIEGYIGASEADDDETIAGIGVDYEKNWEWGVTLRPGLSFVDSYMPLGLKPYGIVGYRRAEYEVSADGIGSTEEKYNGFELGFGSEVIAYQDFGVRVDYSHVFYGDKDGVDIDEDNIRLGVAYHF